MSHGFPSPANDFVETRLTVDSLCQMYANCSVIETSTGYAVINQSLKAEQGNIMLSNHCGRTQFAKLMKRSLITDKGKALEGDALDDVTVSGVMTYEINVIRRPKLTNYP